MADISAHLPSPKPAWIRHFAQVGLTSKGIVYCIVGAIAFMAAFEVGGRQEQDAGKSGVFRFIIEQPFGKVLLAIVAAGMLCYTVWRLIQAFKDTENKGSDLKGIGQRVVYAFSGLVYGSLALLAIRMVIGTASGNSSGNDSRQMLATELLKQPFGQWLVGLVAVGTMATGIQQLYRALSGKYAKDIRSIDLQQDVQKTLIRAGMVGHIARGVVWLVIGYMFMLAALAANGQEAGGTANAFSFLENTTYGSFLLGIVAIGLICYGVFMFVRAKYGIIRT